MVAVTEPHDALEIEAASDTSLVIDGPFADGVPADESNLVWRALDAMGVRAAVRAAQGNSERRRSRRRIGRRGRGARARSAPPRRLRQGSAPMFRSACTAAPHACAGIGDVVEPVDLPETFVVIATPPFSVRHRRRLPGVGRPRRAA